MFDTEESYWWYIGLHQLIIKIINKSFKNSALNILDAGCGTCRLMQLLKESGYNTEGFDMSELALNFCKKRNIANITKQDINTWQPHKKYDIIISADVICSIGIDDEQKIINKFLKALNHNGILILNLPAFEILRRNHDKAVFIRKRYTKKALKKILTKAGFHSFRIHYRLPWLFFIILIKKISQKIIKSDTAESDLKKLPAPLNYFFLLLNKIDNFFLTKNISLPLGSSVFVIAKKTD